MSHAVLSLLKESRHPMRIDLIGVAGSGMSGLASLLLALGHKVSGSDKVTTLETDRLVKLGLQFFSPHSEKEVEDCDMVIYSSAIKPGNVAYEAAYKQGIPLVRRAEALAAVMANKKGVVVGGTHGKTTTSALTAHVLRQGGLKPSHYVGAEIPILGANAHWDHEGELFVAEGDESDGTLVNFHPQHSIILNIEPEHLDFYDGIEAIKAVFRQLLSQTPGYWVHCAEDPVAREVCSGPQGVSYGWSRDFDFSANILAMKPDHSDFEVYQKDTLLGIATLGIPGKHNVSNALAAIALATKLGVPFENIQRALKSFRGAKRRFEIRHSGERFTVVDDYGHHPSEIAATLATAKGLAPQRIVCLFQPHRYSRTQLLKKEFGASFGDVDELFVTDVYAASEKPLPGVSGETIVEEVKAQSATKAQSTPTLLLSRDKVGNTLRPGDLLITLGAGNVHEVGRCIARDLPVLEKLWTLLEAHGGGVARLYEPMARHTTFLIGGPAQYWIEPRSIEGFAQIVRYLRAHSVPIRVIGRGSNLLVKDGGIRGAVLHPSKGEFEDVRVEGETLIVGVGTRLKKIASAARNAGLGGFEWMEGVPGNLGGAIRMNAGAMGTETFDQIVSVRFIDTDGQIKEKPLAEIQHHYRSVPEFEERYIVSAVLKGTPADQAEIDTKLAASHQKRRTSQPVGASAGCAFKNPEVCGAGKLIDDLGLKGRSVGKAIVSDIHGNFIVNSGGATARQVLDLVAEIQEVAQRERGVQLEMEVKVIGEDQPMGL
ncbi:UDP-N-acetylmuramate dehydrogenase /UDP-N-acetylmuramate--L-alanine ligase [Prosthecobacter debontii]|uniref:Multifunctional fusion protein n=1 Tax=Prosthecobacter debontii TaxID=48467 RepID=A0A1T4WJ65_9BACT|nr:UDP-N-acetylmuramate--L-alanine ligase [Prosthecobacter debontii]SKA76948.1 UDP-N-acetylmuramate dehydrogenase /UDP-N-acetylmuramate--L-alanine ligase [Prosthecobacter debontii]